MNRRLIKIAAVACAAMLSLSACGNGDNAAPATGGETTAGSKGTNGSGGNGGSSDRANKLYAWMTTENDRAQWQAFVDAAKEVDAEFSLEIEGPSFVDYWTLARTRMQAQDAPCLMATQAARAKELGGVLAPLDELVEKAGVDLSTFDAAMLEGLTVDGTLRGIPYDAEPIIVYYSKSAFQAAGVDEPTLDWTRDDFLAAAQALTGDGKYGFAVQPQMGSSPTLAFAFANGSAPTKDGQPTLDDPAFVADAQWVFDLIAEHGVGVAPQPGDAPDVQEQRFASGEAAMLIHGPWKYNQFTKDRDGDVAIATVPAASGDPKVMIQGSAFGIADSCPDKEAAFENLMKISTPEVQTAVTHQRGIVPAIYSVQDAWAEGKPAADAAVIEFLSDKGVPYVTADNWNQVETLFTQYSSEGFSGARSAEEIFGQIQSSMG